MPTPVSPARPFRGVIFDLDGTLFNSLDDLSESMNEVLKQHRFPTHPSDSYRYFVGDGMNKLVTRALPGPARQDPATVTQCLEDMRTVYHRRWHRHSTLYPGVPAMLDGLVARGLALAIFSNKPQAMTMAVHEKFLAAWPFQQVRGATADLPLKPDPAGAWAIARDLRLQPAELLYLGDTSVDMQTARAAGMYGIGCLWGFREQMELEVAGARFLLNRPPELLNWLADNMPGE